MDRSSAPAGLSLVARRLPTDDAGVIPSYNQDGLVLGGQSVELI